MARFVMRDVYRRNLKTNAMRSDTNPRREHARHARTNRSGIFFLAPLVSSDKLYNTVHAEREIVFTRTYPCEPEAKHERTSRGELAPCTEPNQQDSSLATLPSKLEESSILVSLYRHYALTYILHTYHSQVAVRHYLTTTFFFFVLYRVAL